MPPSWCSAMLASRSDPEEKTACDLPRGHTGPHRTRFGKEFACDDRESGEVGLSHALEALELADYLLGRLDIQGSVLQAKHDDYRRKAAKAREFAVGW